MSAKVVELLLEDDEDASDSDRAVRCVLRLK